MSKKAPPPGAVALPVRGGRQTLVDPDVAGWLAGQKLCLSSPRGYVKFSRCGCSVFLHHCVAGFPLFGKQIDHRNADRLDNRAANLRVISRAHNLFVRRRRPGLSGLRGVYRDRRRGRWDVSVGWERKRHRRFGFPSAIEAALARDDLAMEVTGLREGLNFPFAVRRRDLRGFLQATRGRLFRVWFRKRSDGAVRSMVCRTGVHAHCKGGPTPVDPAHCDLLGVFDVHVCGYRFIPLEGVLAVRFQKRQYRIVS